MKKSYLKRAKLLSCLSIIIVFINTVAYGQDFKAEKVTLKDLEQQQHPLEADAAAAVLHRTGNLKFIVIDGRWEMITEVHTRTKIYKNEGLKFATHELDYYTGGRRISVYYSDACTYNLVDGEIVKTKLRSDGQFKEEATEKFNTRKIVLPDVRVGSIIEFTYTIRSPYLVSVRDWHFQFDIPADYVSYRTDIPSCFTYNKYLYGYIENIEKGKPYLRDGASRYRDWVESYTAKNVPSLKEEPFTDNMDNYRSTIKMELSAVHYEGEEEKHYASTWVDVAKEIFSDEDFGKELEKTSYFAGVSEVGEARADKEGRCKAIFKFVRDYMNWNGDKSYFCEQGVKKAFETKTGNSAEINLMLTAMLRKAGLDANPVLLSTRSNGVSVHPSRTAFNYVICAVNLDGKTILLDATSKYSTPGLLPERAINWVGRLIKKDGTNEEISLFPEALSLKSITISATLGKDGTIEGMAREQNADQFALSFREKHAGTSGRSLQQLVEKTYNIAVSDYNIKQLNEQDKPVIEEFSFNAPGAVEVIGERMYVDPMVFAVAHNNPFTQDERKYPVDFIHPKQHRTAIVIKIPEGYVVESLPEAISFVMDQEVGSYKYNIKQQGDGLQISSMLTMNLVNVSAEFYPILKDFYGKVVEKQNEKIVLKRI